MNEQDSEAREIRAALVVELLAGEYPDAHCELDFENPWQLLVATVLSAQCTDERVNRVTPDLFSRWSGPGDLARASQKEVEDVIRSTGMFRVKAKSLRAAAQVIESDHGGDVPAEIDALVAMPGVGRKTAKVVLGEAYEIAAGVTVDTHVRRLAQRLDLTDQHDPEKIAGELEALIPRTEWIKFATRLIHHGRRVCAARNPQCASCVLADTCPRIGIAI